MAEQAPAPGRRADQTQQDPDCRRLARTIGPKETVRAARGDSQVYAVDGAEVRRNFSLDRESRPQGKRLLQASADRRRGRRSGTGGGRCLQHARGHEPNIKAAIRRQQDIEQRCAEQPGRLALYGDDSRQRRKWERLGVGKKPTGWAEITVAQPDPLLVSPPAAPSKLAVLAGPWCPVNGE